MRQLIPLLLLVLLGGCTSKKKTTTLPPQKISPEAKAVIGLLFEGEARPGMVRESKKPITTVAEALAGFEALFPKYRGRVECYTVLNDFFVLSLKPLESEAVEGAQSCSYGLVVYVKKGERALRYYWSLKQ